MARGGMATLAVLALVLAACSGAETGTTASPTPPPPRLTSPMSAPPVSPTASAPVSWGRSVTDPRAEPLLQAEPRYARVLARHSMVTAGQVWDMETGTLTFRLVDNAEGRKTRAELTALHLPMPIRFERAARSTRELMAVASRLFATRASWAAGLRGLGYMAPDETNGRLIIGVLDRYQAEWIGAVAAAHLDIPIKIQGEPEVGVHWQ